MARKEPTSLGRSHRTAEFSVGRRKWTRRIRQGQRAKEDGAETGFAPELTWNEDRVRRVTDPWRREPRRKARWGDFTGRIDRDGDDSKLESWYQERPTGPFWRTRRRVSRGPQVNQPDPIPMDQTPWLEFMDDGDVRDIATGRLMSETNEGVTWQDGEDRLKRLSKEAGARNYPTRGPVLWAMRRIKFERFAKRTKPTDLAGQEEPKELDGDACSLWALLRRDPSAIQRRDVRDAMERAGWPPDVVAELRAGEELSRAGRDEDWVWVPGSCEWRQQKGRQVALF